MAMTAGCHRGYFRTRADQEARQLIAQKSCDPRWETASGNVEVDAASRMFDPFCQDHIPLPPDDPSSHRLMHCVDCKPGYPCWHANGDATTIQNPAWLDSLPLNAEGQLVLSLDQAYELALLHSPDLQQQRETLYLSALDVSLERFGFDAQLFAGFNSFLTTQGRQRTGTGQSQTTLSNQLGSTGQGINFQKLGVTGATLTAGLANTILWNFSSNSTQTASSLLNFSLIQPLLRDAGRERILEALTQAERTLLANVRQLARFRRALYVQVAIGRDANSRLNRNGQFLTPPSPAPTNVGGFIGLQQLQQRIRNQAYIVRQLEGALERFRELFLRERINAIQVKQFESTVYSQQQSLLVAQNQYLNSLDQFKRLLGLPPDIQVVVEDPFLDRFELIDDQLNDRLEAIAKIRDSAGLPISRLTDLQNALRATTDDPDAAPNTDVSQPLTTGLSEIRQQIILAQQVLKSILDDDRQLLESDLARLRSVRQQRIDYLSALRGAIDSGEIQASVDLQLFETTSIPDADKLSGNLNGEAGLLAGFERVQIDLVETIDELAKLEKVDWTSAEGSEQLDTLKATLENAPDRLSSLSNLVLDLSLLQATVRSNSIEIVPVRLDSAQAAEIARCFRRDWMNARASLVDRWRAIEFFADQLDATVDLVFEGDIGNVTDNPFRLNHENGQLRAGLRFDAPIVRVAERNRYREALIEYQRGRRLMYQFEDEVKRNLRQILRTIDQDKILFELNRRSVQVNIEQVELNRFALVAPQPLNTGGGGSSRFGATTARDLIQALTGLNSSLNDILDTWVEYEALRMNLDFDLGTMQLDEGFRWIDPGPIDVSIADFAASMMGWSSANCCLPGENSTVQAAPGAYDGGIETTGDGAVPAEPPRPAFEPDDAADTVLEPSLVAPAG